MEKEEYVFIFLYEAKRFLIFSSLQMELNLRNEYHFPNNFQPIDYRWDWKSFHPAPWGSLRAPRLLLRGFCTWPRPALRAPRPLRGEECHAAHCLLHRTFSSGLKNTCRLLLLSAPKVVFLRLDLPRCGDCRRRLSIRTSPSAFSLHDNWPLRGDCRLRLSIRTSSSAFSLHDNWSLCGN